MSYGKKIDALLQDKIGKEKDVHAFFINMLKDNIREKHNIFPRCFDKDLHNYKYKICWFRSFAYMLTLCPIIRNIILTKLSESIPIESIPIESKPITEYKLKTFMQTFLMYFENFSHTNIYNFMSLDDNFTTEDALLYFISLLNKYNNQKFPYENVTSGYPRRLILRFFNYVVGPLLYDGELSKPKIFTVDKNPTDRSIVPNLNVKNNQVQPNPEDPDMIVLDYGILRTPINYKLALYVKYNDKTYCLSALSIRNTLTIKQPSSLIFGHAFPIYRCNDRFYSTDEQNSDFLGINDVNLVEKMINGEGNLKSFSNMIFNLDKGQRIAIYTKNQLSVSPDDFVLLCKLRQNLNSNSFKECLSILSYFCEVLNFTIDNVDYTLRSNEHYFDKTITWSIKATSIDKSVQFYRKSENFKVLYDFRSPITTHQSTKKCDQELRECVNAINKHLLTDLEFIKFSNFEIISCEVRNRFHVPLMSSLLCKHAKVGGGKSTKLKYQNKLYTIRQDKTGKYITSRRAKIYLSTIRGKYRYANLN